MSSLANIGSVIFVGAGPGDPELLTIKAKKAIEEADVIIYAGSLVPQAIVELAAIDALKYDSSGLTLDQIHILMSENARLGKKVVRLHTGDPSLYGALSEQIALLDEDHIPWSVIPGVTAAMAAAAAAGISFSIPESVQTLILTRAARRTPMPEDIAKLASTGANMAIYLGGGDGVLLQQKLRECLPAETPIICAHRVGWPDELICRATLGTLSECVENNNLARQTVILILPGSMRCGGASCLYDANFKHGFRR